MSIGAVVAETKPARTSMSIPPAVASSTAPRTTEGSGLA
jgi:hypothetical protein